MFVFTYFIWVSKYLSVYGAEAAIEQYKNQEKNAPAFCTLFLRILKIKQQKKLTTSLDLLSNIN